MSVIIMPPLTTTARRSGTRQSRLANLVLQPAASDDRRTSRPARSSRRHRFTMDNLDQRQFAAGLIEVPEVIEAVAAEAYDLASRRG
jgi:hypothetical protein